MHLSCNAEGFASRNCQQKKLKPLIHHFHKIKDEFTHQSYPILSDKNCSQSKKICLMKAQQKG
jgi:hypothetical protein